MRLTKVRLPLAGNEQVKQKHNIPAMNLCQGYFGNQLYRRYTKMWILKSNLRPVLSGEKPSKESISWCVPHIEAA